MNVMTLKCFILNKMQIIGKKLTEILSFFWAASLKHKGFHLMQSKLCFSIFTYSTQSLGELFSPLSYD